MKAPRKVTEIARNDVGACQRFYAAHGATADEAEMMLMLQDDTTELDAVMARERWKIRPQ